MGRLSEIADGVLVGTSELHMTTTTVVVGSGGRCLVIDPAITPADLAVVAAELTALGLEPAVGWSTHPHWDHVLWSRELGEVPRFAAPRAAAAATAGRVGLADEAEQEVPGHELELIGRLTALEPDAARIPWDGPDAQVVVHDGHAPGHGAVFLPDSGVLVAGDMCSDIEIPLLDGESADPFGDYRHGLGALASLPGVRVVVPGHGHVGDSQDFQRRVAADFGYLDAVEAGREPEDPRLAEEWLRGEHARQRALVSAGLRGRPPHPR
jgi:glyoxylase-like metal-dependent hydrolase (beta-lactamase superfamily II)